jgi:hypothetical protein
MILRDAAYRPLLRMRLCGFALLALLLCLPNGAQAHGHRNGTSLYNAVHSSDSRPHAWCGWWMRSQVDRDPGPQFNLARSWASYGAPAPGPEPGVIGVMPHHVFKVLALLGRDRHGRAIVLAISGNDGHAVRTRPRSTAGVIAWRRA